MNLNGYYNDEILNKMLEEEKISHLEYIFHHSPEMKAEFEEFCNEKGLTQDEKAARAYFDHWMEEVSEDIDIDADLKDTDSEVASTEENPS